MGLRRTRKLISVLPHTEPATPHRSVLNGHSERVDVFNLVVNVALILLTAVVVYFAWRTVREGRDAGEALKATVASLKELIDATGRVAFLISQSADAANRTVASLEDLLAATCFTAN
jgi:hypothetical protein